MACNIAHRAAALALLGSLAAVSSCKKVGADSETIDPEDAAKIAVDAYVYGYPLVTMDMTRRVMTNVATPTDKHAPMGQFANMSRYPDASFKDVTAPNANTLYSAAWLDLSAEPYVLELPDEHGRYYLMPMLSGWTNVFEVPGTRTTGTKAQKYLISGPNWSGSPMAGAVRIKAPTNMAWIIGRTFAKETRSDLKAVNELQAEYKLTPLSAYGHAYVPPPGNVDPSIDMKTPVRDQVNKMGAVAYFNRLAMLMQANPPARADSIIVRRMARLGIKAGQPFDSSKLDRKTLKVVIAAPAVAQQAIIAHGQSIPVVNGWSYTTRTGRYGTDYLQRSYITWVGLGANLPQDAIYPVAEVDATGNKLNGANNYVLHFNKGETPPVKGFWSLTMYDPQMFFVANPLNRYQISPAQSPVKTNPDGSLDIYIQHSSPGADRQANWLPAPSGPFVLMLRFYEPGNEIIGGQWKPPGVMSAQQVAATQ